MQNTMIAGLLAAMATVGGVATCLCLPGAPGDARDALEAFPSHSLPRVAPLERAVGVEPATPDQDNTDLEAALRSRALGLAPGSVVAPAIWTQARPRALPIEV